MDGTLKNCMYSITKIEFFEEWQKHAKIERNIRLFEFILEKFDLSNLSDESLRNIKVKLASLSTKFGERWTACGKSKDSFLKKYADWLNGEDLKFSVSIYMPQLSASAIETSKHVGRPKKEFEAASFKTKKRRVDDLLRTRSIDELATAAEVAVRLSGHRDAANLIREVSTKSEKVREIKKLQSINTMRSLTGDEALAYYVDAKLTSSSYNQTRKWAMKAGHRVFPSYYAVRQAKRNCCLSEENIVITETRTEIKVQAMLDLTVTRLLSTVQSDLINIVGPNSSFTLISKWGCDGSSGHSTYKQKFTNVQDSDEFLFMFSFVPLQLTDGDNIIWQNPRHSSTMYCRPLKFIFAKETTELTVSETNKIKAEIDQLLPTMYVINNYEIFIKHKLLLTMIDGKVCNALTETRSSQKCYICGATPKNMNNETKKFVSNENNFGFGLSTLHAWIRCFECLLHISYRLGVNKWQVRDEQEKAIVKERKIKIQITFKNEMGLIVDKPKPGCGSTNDGNTARRFFKNPELSAKITGLNVTLIQNFSTLLRALSSGYDINLIEFQKLANETRKIYLNHYSWYYMPVTVHKILIHSVEIIKHSLLPIGQLSEEAQEARNKDCRRFRENNTRKLSRNATNKDLVTMLCITSDPVINSLREIPRKRFEAFPSEVLQLLLAPKIRIRENTITVSESSSETDIEEIFSD